MHRLGRPQPWRWLRSRWLMRGWDVRFKDFGHEPFIKPKPLTKDDVYRAVKALEERDRGV
jgi:hypothetical protein